MGDGGTVWDNDEEEDVLDRVKEEDFERLGTAIAAARDQEVTRPDTENSACRAEATLPRNLTVRRDGSTSEVRFFPYM